MLLCLKSEACLSFFFKATSGQISDKHPIYYIELQSSVTPPTDVDPNSKITTSTCTANQPYPYHKFKVILETQTFVKTCFKMYANTISMYESPLHFNSDVYILNFYLLVC